MLRSGSTNRQVTTERLPGYLSANMRFRTIVLGAALLIACNDPAALPLGRSDTVQPPGLDQAFELAFGTTAEVAEADVSVGFVAVQDSRCPDNQLILCVWAGDGAAQLELTRRDAQPVTRTLHTLLDPKRILVPPDNAYEIELLSLDPFPTEVGGVPDSEYIATLIVRSMR